MAMELPYRKKKGGSKMRLLDLVKDDVQLIGVTEEDAGQGEMESAVSTPNRKS